MYVRVYQKTKFCQYFLLINVNLLNNLTLYETTTIKGNSGTAVQHSAYYVSAIQLL